jgi:chloramphenicol 3-O-phosphotransferase
MDTIKVVAISGGMCAGKTALAKRLVDVLNGPADIPATGADAFFIESIAAHIKDAAGSIFGVPVTADTKAAYRPMLQAMAVTNEALGNSERWIDRLVSALDAGDRVVIDDVRFKYELDFLLDARRKGYLEFVHVHVDTPEAVRAERYFNLYGQRPTREQLQHPSEVDLYDAAGNVYTPDDNVFTTVRGDGALCVTAATVADFVSVNLLLPEYEGGLT